MVIKMDGEPISDRWEEFGVEDLEGNVEAFDEVDEALDVVLLRRALYGPDKEGHIVTREVIAGPWKKSDTQPHSAES